MSANKLTPEEEHEFISWERGKMRGKVALGALIVFFGVIFLLRAMKVDIPRWTYHPSSILIAVGIVALFKHKFKNLTGFILIAIGVFWKLKFVYPDMIDFSLLWPLLAIVVGVSIILRSKGGSKDKSNKWEKIKKHPGIFGLDEQDVSPEDFVDGVSIFGAIKKQVTTKTFKGADLFTLFGGTELNLTQASFNEKAVVELTTIFGGAEVIVPSDWTVKTEIVSIFGATEDNRYHRSQDETPEKVLILRGTCVFGGVEVKSYSV